MSQDAAWAMLETASKLNETLLLIWMILFMMSGFLLVVGPCVYAAWQRRNEKAIDSYHQANDVVLHKMKKILQTSDLQSLEQQRIVRRYLTLANRDLHKRINRNPTFSCLRIIGASIALKAAFQCLAGRPFVPQLEPVRLTSKTKDCKP